MGDLAAAAASAAPPCTATPDPRGPAHALAAEAGQELVARVTDAGLDRVPVPEALQRLARALLAVGDRYGFLARQRANPLTDWTRASGYS